MIIRRVGLVAQNAVQSHLYLAMINVLVMLSETRQFQVVSRTNVYVKKGPCAVFSSLGTTTL